jgi:hypothetical protein
VGRRPGPLHPGRRAGGASWALANTGIALQEIERVLAAGARFGIVLADAGYGTSAASRQGLSERGLTWAVGVLKTQNVHPPTVEQLWPKAARGRPCKHPVPSEGPVAAAFAASRVRPAEGARLRNGRHLPGQEVWFVGERRSGGERRCYLADLPAATPLEQLAPTVKAR